MIKIMAFLLIGVVTAGCNGFVKPDLSGPVNEAYFPVFSGFPMPYMYMASAVQWNEDYAVTTGHTPFIPNVAYRCSTRCDLVFIKHKANGHFRHEVSAAGGREHHGRGREPLPCDHDG